MDTRDRVIGTQVAFKGAIDLCGDLDLASDDGQKRFEMVFSYLQDSLSTAMVAAQDPAEQAAQIIQGNFPGTQVVSSRNASATYQPTPYVQPGSQQGFQLSVKGNQFGPLPDWLYTAAAEKGVTEVYDNRDKAMGTKRPWFRSTTGGDNAPAFWPPR